VTEEELMSFENALKSLGDFLEIAEDAARLAKTVGRAIANGDTEHVEHILPATSRTELQGQLKDALARAKFGPRPGSGR
jgi:hypothetical protein